MNQCFYNFIHILRIIIEVGNRVPAYCVVRTAYCVLRRQRAASVSGLRIGLYVRVELCSSTLSSIKYRLNQG